jgi:DNA-binding MarR family transcriptional regulator
MRRRDQQEESDERILGSGDFVHAVLQEAEERHLRQMKLRRIGRSIPHIIQEECEKRRISPEELKRGGRRIRVSEARAAIACRSKEELGLSGAEIARHLGVNTSSINRAIARVERGEEN